jgi:hypothetical protein
MEETTSTSFSWTKDAMKNGAILGIAHIFIMLIIYYAFPDMLTGFTYLVIILVLNIGFSVYCSIEYRKELGGYVDFGTIFKYVFVLLVTNGIINIIFAGIFILIEPAYPQVVAQSQLETSVYWAQKFNAPENQIEKMRDEFNFEEIEKRFSFTGLLFSFGIGIIFYAIGAVIVALIVRKREPEII